MAFPRSPLGLVSLSIVVPTDISSSFMVSKVRWKEFRASLPPKDPFSFLLKSFSVPDIFMDIDKKPCFHTTWIYTRNFNPYDPRLTPCAYRNNGLLKNISNVESLTEPYIQWPEYKLHIIKEWNSEVMFDCEMVLCPLFWWGFNRNSIILGIWSLC